MAKTTQPRDLEGADMLVHKALEIVEYFRPEVWWLENPRMGMLSRREFMQGIPFVDVDYCQYSDWGYKKPTRIWGCPRVKVLKLKQCDHRTCPNLTQGTAKHKVGLSSKHQNLPRDVKHRIPSALVDDIVYQFECARSNRQVKLPIRLLKDPDMLEVGKVAVWVPRGSCS